MFQRFKRLAQQGILGINNRNANFTLKYNPRHLYPIVDNKLRTKELAMRAGMAVPELYGVVEIERQIRDLHQFLRDYSDFVVKPAGGSGGDGIVVITGRTKDLYRKASGSLVSREELGHHISNTLSGLYSLGGHNDKAIIEYRVQPDPIFDSISYQGVPDVRIIVFLGFPVMSMVRLPTRLSDGKANLHQGAVGAGIDIATGRTLTAVWRNDIVTEHPDTGQVITDVVVPHWETLLELAARCYELTGLGYQGVDIVLDKYKGPMILELNARPGLNIQIANQSGLLSRLRLVEQHYKSFKTVASRIEFSKNNFGIPSTLF
ncbi:alpha-L-glutamate ligase-like protein [Deltaproteobacteria bacterium TL4]